MKEALIEFTHEGDTLEAFVAWDDTRDGPLPGVLISHAWSGRNTFECGKARALAAQGYAGFALDLYGKGVRGANAEQSGALMQPFLDDRPRLQRRLTAAGADWQIHVYGNTLHSFTNPQANDPAFGTVYDAKADRRSWATLLSFLDEVLE